MVAARDQRFGVRSADKKKQREDIATPAVQQGADAWLHGKALQLEDPSGSEHGRTGRTGRTVHERTPRPRAALRQPGERARLVRVPTSRTLQDCRRPARRQ